MEKLIINGGKKLSGEISISGAKNAAVAILPATVLAKGVYTIENVPDIKDITSIFNILEFLGAEIEKINSSTYVINTEKIEEPKELSFALTSKLRASYYFIGSLLGRFGKANVAMPGGCKFGDKERPIDLHISGFEKLGADINITAHDKDTPEGKVVDYFVIEGDSEKLEGRDIAMSKVSVGATINIMLAAVMAEGTTCIKNAAREPHVVDLANFLISMGAKIKGAGTDKITITGVKELTARDYTIIPDQIEAGTYMVAAAATRGDVTIRNIIPIHLKDIADTLRECGATVTLYEDSVNVKVDGPLKCCDVHAKPYPGFPTDMQPQFATLLSICEGRSKVSDEVWDDRFKYVEQLKKMGADITVTDPHNAVLNGVSKLTATDVVADDLRAGAAMIIAGLVAEGTTEISGICHIDRGYENIVEKLSAVCAEISRKDFPEK